MGPNGPVHLNMSLTRAKFDELTHHLVERTLGPVRQALKDAKLTPKDIDQYYLSVVLHVLLLSKKQFVKN